MVKVTAPALSLGASGSIGGALTFSTWKGRPYVRELVKPSNPRSGGQVGVRAMFKFLSQFWTQVGAAPKATWNDLADDKIISPFNAYMGYNQARWRNFKSPTLGWPATESASVGTYENEAATAGVRQIDVEIEVTAAGNAVGVLIFRSPDTGFNTSFANCIAAIAIPGLSVGHYIDTPLDPGTYYYNFRGFNSDGVMNAEEGEVSDTVV